MSEEMGSAHVGRILVVDDTTANLQLLTTLLTAHGYTVHPASGGELALQFVQLTQPDIILLDIKMSGMDGYEVCQRLKADESTRSIPIIFISVLEDEQDKVKGFQAGAVDYISKPFQPEEVLARVKSQLQLRKMTEHLEQRVAERTEELHAANAQLQRELSERKQTEVTLRQSETLLNATQRLAKIGGWEWDAEKQISFWTEETYRIHGFEPQSSAPGSSEHLDRSLACYDPADRPIISAAFKRCAELGEDYDLEFPFTAVDGCRKWVRTTATAVRKQGRIVKVLGNIMDITQHKQAQEKLSRERSLLRTLIDSVSDLIFVKNREGVYQGCNKASEAFIGLPECEQIGKTDFDFFDHEKAEEIQKADRQILEGGKPLHIEEWVTGRDGRRLLIDTIKAPYFNPDGKALGLVGIGRDITERKRAQQERLALLDFFENLDSVNRAIQTNNDLEKMMSAVLDVVLSAFECDRAYLISPCDPEAPDWHVSMERNKAEYPGLMELGAKVRMDPQVAKTFRILLATEGPVTFGPNLEHELDGAVAERFNIKCFIAMAIYPKTGGPWQFGIHQCTHARIWTAEEKRLFQEIGRRLVDGLSTLLIHRDLRHSMEKLEEAQHLAHIGSWELDLTQNTMTWSDEIFRMFEINPEKFGASHEAFLAAVHPEDLEAVNLAYTNSRKTKIPITIEHRLLFPDERIKYVRAQCETHFKGDEPVRTSGTTQDITERKTAEEALRHLNTELEQRVTDRTDSLEAANKELEAFAYSISHDLRAPLRHIDGFLGLLQKKADSALDEQSRHYMDAIVGAANKMGLLIDDLLSFSRMGRHGLSCQQVKLRKLVSEVILEFEPDTAGRSIKWCIDDLPTVEGDGAMLRMVLVNLISNALKFTRPRQQAKVEIGSQNGQDGDIVIYIRDNGVGFDMAFVDKLFGVFQRLHRADEFEGTGIGLANVRRIIDRHGGQTWAEGKLDQGATFYFLLPQKQIRPFSLDEHCGPDCIKLTRKDKV